uniref:RNA-directed RNA polymerase L n=1 Tax=Periplaneta americana nairovirus 3 TaxID=3133472 RepID=A0AAT9JFL9_9VIRU
MDVQRVLPTMGDSQMTETADLPGVRAHRFPNDIFHRLSTVPFRYEMNYSSEVVKMTVDYGNVPIGWQRIPLSSVRDYVYNQGFSMEYTSRLFEYLDETWIMKKVWKNQHQGIRQLLIPSIFLRKTSACIFVYSFLKHISMLDEFVPNWESLWMLVARGFKFDPLPEKLESIQDIATETFVYMCTRKTLETQHQMIMEKIDALNLTSVIQLNTMSVRLMTTIDEWVETLNGCINNQTQSDSTNYSVRQVAELVDKVTDVCKKDRRSTSTRQETSWGTGISHEARKECEALIRTFFKKQNMTKAVSSGGVVTSLSDHASVVAYIQFLILSDTIDPEDRLILTEKRDDIINTLGVNTIYPLVLMKEQYKSLLRDFNIKLEGDALKSVQFFSQLIESASTYSEMWRSLLNIKGICMEYIFCKSHGIVYLSEHRKPTIQSIVDYYFNDKFKDFMDSSMSQTRLREHCPDVFLVVRDEKKGPSVSFSESSREVSPDGGVEIVMTKAQSGGRVTKTSDTVDADTAEKFVMSRHECSLFVQRLISQLRNSPGTEYNTNQKNLKRDTVLVLIELGYQTNSKDKAESDQRLLRSISTLLTHVGIHVLTVATSVSSEHLQQAQWLDGELSRDMKRFLSPMFAKLASSIPPDLKMMNFSSITNQSIRRSMTSLERKLSFIQDFDVLDHYAKCKEELITLQNESKLPLNLQKDLESSLVLGSTISTRDATKVHSFLSANATYMIGLVQSREGDCPEVIDNNSYLPFLMGSMKEELSAITDQQLCKELSAMASLLRDTYKKYSRGAKNEHSRKELVDAIGLYETTKAAHETSHIKRCSLSDIHCIKHGWIQDILCSINNQLVNSDSDLVSIQFGVPKAPSHEGKFYSRVVTKSEMINSRITDDGSSLDGEHEGDSVEDDDEYEEVYSNTLIQQCKMHFSKFTSLILPGRTAKQKKARQPLMAVKQLISAYSGGLLVDSTGLIQAPLPALLKMAGMSSDLSKEPVSIADQTFDLDTSKTNKVKAKKLDPFVDGRNVKFSTAYKAIVGKLDKSLALKGSLTKDAYNTIKTVKKTMSLGSSYFQCTTVGEFFDIVAPDNVIKSQELVSSIGILLNKSESGDPVHNFFSSKAERKVRLDESKKFDNRFPLFNTDDIHEYLIALSDIVRIDLNPSEETMFIEQMFTEMMRRFGENSINAELVQTMRRFCRLFMSTGIGQTLLVYSYICMTFLTHTSEFVKPGLKVSRLPCIKLNLLTKVNRNRHENHLTMLLDENFSPVSKPFFLRRDRATLGQGACYTTALFIYQALQCTCSTGFLFEMRLTEILAECSTYMEISSRFLVDVLKEACTSGALSVIEKAEHALETSKEAEIGLEGVSRQGILRFCNMITNFTIAILPSMLCNSKNVSALFQMLRFPLNLCVSDVGFPFGVGSKLDCPHRKTPHLISKLYCRLMSCLVIRSHDRTLSTWKKDEMDPARHVVSVMCFPSCCNSERQLQSDMYICHFFHKVLSDFAGERIKAFADFCEKVHDWDKDLTKTLSKIKKLESQLLEVASGSAKVKLKEKIDDLRTHARLLLCVKDRHKKRPLPVLKTKNTLPFRGVLLDLNINKGPSGTIPRGPVNVVESTTSSSSSGSTFNSQEGASGKDKSSQSKKVSFKGIVNVDMDPMIRVSDWMATSSALQSTQPTIMDTNDQASPSDQIQSVRKRLRGIMMDVSMTAADKRRRRQEEEDLQEDNSDDGWYIERRDSSEGGSSQYSDNIDEDPNYRGSKSSLGSSANSSDISRGSTYTVSSADEDLPFTRQTTSINEPVNQSKLWKSIKTCINHDPNHSFCVPEVLQACAEYSKSSFSSLNIQRSLATKYMHEQSSSATETTSIIKEIVERITPTQMCSIVRRATVLKCTKYFNLYRNIDLEGQTKTKGLEESLLNLIDNFTIKLDDESNSINDEIERRVREMREFVGQMKAKRLTTWQDVCKQSYDSIFESESSFLIMAFMKSLHKYVRTQMKDAKPSKTEGDGHNTQDHSRAPHTSKPDHRQKKAESLWTLCRNFMDSCTERGGILNLGNRIFIDSKGPLVSELCDKVRNDVMTEVLNHCSMKNKDFMEHFAMMIELFTDLQASFDDLQESKKANPLISYPDKTHRVSSLETDLFNSFSEELSTCCLLVLAAGSVTPYVCSDKTSSSPIIFDAVRLIKAELEAAENSESPDIAESFAIEGLLPKLFTNFSAKVSVSRFLEENFGPATMDYSNLVKYCILIILNIKRPYTERKTINDVSFPKPMSAQEGVEQLMIRSSVDRLDLDVVLWCASLVLGNETICRRLLNRMEKGIRLPRSLRSKVIFEMINMIQKTDSTNLMDMGSYFLQDQYNPIYAGISPKAQIGATRDLFVLYSGSKLQIRTTESLSRALMSTCTTRDALTDKRAKDRFLTYAKTMMQMSLEQDGIHVGENSKVLHATWNIIGDCTKWGPIHSSASFSTYMQQLLSTTPDWSPHVRLLMLKFLTKHIEVPPEAIVKIINSFFDDPEFVRAKNNLNGSNMDKELSKLMKKHVRRIWSGNKCAISIVEWALSKSRNYIKAYNHMGQGIHHATSSLIQSGCSYLIDDVVSNFIERKMPGMICTIVHTGSSDDFSKCITITGTVTTSKYSQYVEMLPIIKRDSLCLYMALMRCCQMKVSVKTSLSPILAEFYSDFLYLNRRSVSTSKAIIGQVIANAAYSPLTLYQSIHIECQQCMYWGVPLSTILLFAMCKQMIFIMNSITFYKKYGEYLFRSLPSTCRLYVPSYSLLLDSGVLVEELSIITSALSTVTDRLELISGTSDSNSSTAGSSTGRGDSFIRVDSGTSDSISAADINVSVREDTDGTSDADQESDNEGYEQDTRTNSDGENGSLTADEDSTSTFSDDRYSSDDSQRSHSYSEHDKEILRNTTNVMDDLDLDTKLVLTMVCYYSEGESSVPIGRAMLQKKKAEMSSLTDPFCILVPESVLEKRSQVRGAKEQVDGDRLISSISDSLLDEIALGLIAKSAITENTKVELSRVRQALDSPTIIYGLSNGINDLSVSIIRQQLRGYFFNNRTEFVMDDHWVKTDKNTMIAGNFDGVRPKVRVRFESFIRLINGLHVRMTDYEELPEVSVVGIVKMKRACREPEGQQPELVLNGGNLEVAKDKIANLLSLCSTNTAKNMRLLEEQESFGSVETGHTRAEKNFLYHSESEVGIHNNPAIVMASFISKKALIESKPQGLDVNTLETDGQVFYRIYSDIYNYIISVVVNIGATQATGPQSHAYQDPGAVSKATTSGLQGVNQEAAHSSRVDSTSKEKLDVRETIRTLVSLSRMISSTRSERVNLITVVENNDNEEVVPEAVLPTYMSFEGRKFTITPDKLRVSLDNYVYIFKGVISCINWSGFDISTKNSLLYRFLLSSPRDMITKLITYTHLGSVGRCGFLEILKAMKDEIPPGSVESLLLSQGRAASGNTAAEDFRVLGQLATNPTAIIKEHVGKGELTHTDIKGDTKKGFVTLSCGAGSAIVQYNDDIATIMLSRGSDTLLTELMMILGRMSNTQYSNKSSFESKKEFLDTLPLVESHIATTNLGRQWFRLLTIGKDATFRFRKYQPTTDERLSTNARAIFVTDTPLVPKYKTIEKTAPTLTTRWLRSKLQVVIMHPAIVSEIPVSIETLRNTTRKVFSQSTEEEIFSYFNREDRIELVRSVSLRQSVSIQSIALYHMLLKHPIVGPLSHTDTVACVPVPLDSSLSWTSNTDDRQRDIASWRLERWRDGFSKKYNRLPNIEEQEKFIAGQSERTPIGRQSIKQLRSYTRPYELDESKILEAQDNIRKLQTIFSQLTSLNNYPAVSLLLDYFGLADMEVEFKSSNMWKTGITGNWICKTADITKINTLTRVVQSALGLSHKSYNEVFIPLASGCDFLASTGNISDIMVRAKQMLGQQPTLYFMSVYVASIYIRSRCMNVPNVKLMKTAGFVKVITELNPFSTLKLTSDLVMTFSLKDNRVRMVVEIKGVQPDAEARRQIFIKTSQVLGFPELLMDALHLFKTKTGQHYPILSQDEGTVIADLDLQLCASKLPLLNMWSGVVQRVSTNSQKLDGWALLYYHLHRLTIDTSTSTSHEPIANKLFEEGRALCESFLAHGTKEMGGRRKTHKIEVASEKLSEELTKLNYGEVLLAPSEQQASQDDASNAGGQQTEEEVVESFLLDPTELDFFEVE